MINTHGYFHDIDSFSVEDIGLIQFSAPPFEYFECLQFEHTQRTALLDWGGGGGGGGSGGVMVLGKLPVPGRPTTLDV